MPWYFSCKSHWFCGLVQIHPQDVVVFILNTATESGWLSPWDPPLQWGKVRKRIYRPATHPIHFAAVSPDKIHRYAAWAVFFFMGVVPWKFHEPTGRDTDFPSTPLQNRGRNFVRSKRWPHYMSRAPLLIFCVLIIWKHLLKMSFERNGRGQEPSRGHKFSILENFLSIRDFTSSMRLHFRSNLVGACLPQTLLIVRAWWREQTACRAYITSPRSYRTDRRYNDRNECSTDS